MPLHLIFIQIQFAPQIHCIPYAEQVMATLLTAVHFSLPSTPDEAGHIKEIYWKTNAVQVPVVRSPAGDGQTPQVPLDVRLVREDDYL